MTTLQIGDIIRLQNKILMVSFIEEKEKESMKHTKKFRCTVIFSLVLCLIVSIAMPIMSNASEAEVTADEVAIVEKFVADISAYLGTITDVDSAGQEDKMDTPNTGKPILPSLEDYLAKLKADPSYYNLKEFCNLWESWWVGGKAAHAVFLTDTMMNIIKPFADLIDSKGTAEINGDGTCVHFNEFAEDCPEYLRDNSHFEDRTDPSTAKKEDGVPVHPIRDDVNGERNKTWIKRDAYHRNMYGTMDTTIEIAPNHDGNYNKVDASSVNIYQDKFVKVGDVYYKYTDKKDGEYQGGKYFGHPVDENGNPTCEDCFTRDCNCDERFFINCSPDPDITVAKRTPEQLMSHLVEGFAREDEWDKPIMIKLPKELYVDKAPSDFYESYLLGVAEKMNKASTAAEAKALWDDVVKFLNENCKLKAIEMVEYQIKRAKLSLENKSGDKGAYEDLYWTLDYVEEQLHSVGADGYPSFPNAGFSQYRPSGQAMSFISDAYTATSQLIGGAGLAKLYSNAALYYADEDAGKDGTENLKGDGFLGDLITYIDAHEETCSVKTDFSVLDKADDPANPSNPGNQGGNKGPDNTSDSMTAICYVSLVVSVGMAAAVIVFKKRYER